MGLDKIIKNNPEWDNNIDFINIKNNICKTMKEINDALDKNFKNDDKNEENNKKLLKENNQKNNKNYIYIIEKNKNKEKEKEKEIKINKKFNKNYNLIFYKILINIFKIKIKNIKKLKIY
jgi:hypothetical protein